MLRVDNQGSGTIGEISSWSCAFPSTPVVSGRGAGPLGSVSFSAQGFSDTKFTINNYVALDEVDGTGTLQSALVDGNIRSVDMQSQPHSFGVNSIISRLNVDRTATPDASGTYLRGFTIPYGEPYVIGATTYYLGGKWVPSVASVDRVFSQRDVTILDVARDASGTTSNIYVLANDPTMNGEVIITYTRDGQFRYVYPVYSDATDIANPGGVTIAAHAGDIYVVQKNALRVKRMGMFGASFQNQWGTGGTGNGQFTNPFGIACDGSYVFVGDRTACRVQRFSPSGTYQIQWGSAAGSLLSPNTFQVMNYITINTAHNAIYVSDQAGRVRGYDFSGTASGIDMGLFGRGDIFPTGKDIKTSWDSKLAGIVRDAQLIAYTLCDGVMREFHYTSLVPTKTWSAPDLVSFDNTQGQNYGVTTREGKIYSGSLTQLYSYFSYYIGLAAPDITIRVSDGLSNLANPSNDGYIGWTGDVWTMICELAAATGNSLTLVGDTIYIDSRENFSAESNFAALPDDLEPTDATLNSRASGQSVQITNWRSAYYSELTTMYDARLDSEKTFSVAVNSLSYYRVTQNTYPRFVNNPKVTTAAYPAAGEYQVIDKDGLIVNWYDWVGYGGAVRASLTEVPGEILLTIVGPGFEIPGRTSPYTIGDITDHGRLSVVGCGVVSNPEVITIGTGVEVTVTDRTVAQSIDVPFIRNASEAYTQGSWAAYGISTEQVVSFSMSRSILNTQPPTYGNIPISAALYAGRLFEWRDAIYAIDSVRQNNETIAIDCYLYSPIGGSIWQDDYVSPEDKLPSFERIWSGKTAGEFEAYWAGYVAGDFSIAPLRNPYAQGAWANGLPPK